jgi:hypothetical protein
VTRDTHHVNLEQAYRTRTFAREILFFTSEEIRAGIREDFMKSKFFGHALDEATAKTKNQHVIQYISYWRRGRVLRKFWGIVPITAQDAKTIYEADKDSLLYLTDGDEVVLHKGHMGMGRDGAVISGKNTGVAARYKQNHPRVMMNHCACHKSSLSAADGAAGVPELAVFDHQVKSFYNFFGHSVDLRTMHSHVQQRMQETVRHLTCLMMACLMMICSNGPSLHEKEEVEKFLLAVVTRFKAFKKRVPSKTCGGKRPQRASASKAKSSVLSQLSGLENVVFNDFIDD